MWLLRPECLHPDWGANEPRAHGVAPELGRGVTQSIGPRAATYLQKNYAPSVSASPTGGARKSHASTCLPNPDAPPQNPMVDPGARRSWQGPAERVAMWR